MRNQVMILLSSVWVLALVTTPAGAATLNPTIREAATQLRLSAGFLHQDYVEDDSYGLVPTSYLDKEEGSIPALAVDLSVVSAGGWVGKLHSLLAYGKTDYTGYLQRVELDQGQWTPTFTPTTAETDNTIYDTRGNAGYMLALGTRATLTPELELGFTYWRRELQGTGGYTETYGMIRYGGGLQLDIAATEQLVFTLEGIVGAENGYINSDMLDESLGTNPYTRIAVGVDYRLTRRLHLNLQAARIHYSFSESDVSSSGFIEPASTTTHVRVMAGVGLAL